MNKSTETSKDQFTTDAYEVMKKFEQFSYKEMERATKSAMRKGAGVLARATKKILKSKLPAAAKNNSKGKYEDRLLDGVIYKGYENSAKVHILGKYRKRGSGTFRLRFFEGGTILRKHNRNKTNEKSVGKLKALHFFSAARQSAKESTFNAIETQLIKAIEKINQKKINE